MEQVNIIIYFVGSALLGRASRLGNCITGLDYVLNCPLTVKLRTGILDNKPVADKLVSKFIEWNVQVVTLHGRSQQQRYSKLADWDYIKQCAKVANNKIQFFGNGDVVIIK